MPVADDLAGKLWHGIGRNGQTAVCAAVRLLRPQSVTVDDVRRGAGVSSRTSTADNM